MSVGNAQWDIKSTSWIERSSLIVGEIATEYQNILAGAILGAQTYRADLVLSNSLNSSRHVFNDSVTVSAGVTWSNNLTYEGYTIIAQYTEEKNETSTVLIYSNVTNVWTTIDVFQGRIYSLATFGTWLYVGGQFSSEANQSTSLAIYDLVRNNTNIRIHGVTGKLEIDEYNVTKTQKKSFTNVAENNYPGTVNVIKPHPDGKKVLIGGKFSKVGMLDCEAVCAIDPSTLQWDPIALSLTGTAYDMIISTSGEFKKIIVVGDLSVQNQPPTAIASVTDEADNWSTVMSSDQLSGIPNTIVSSVDNEIVVAGTR